jgi:hypothetical protein
MTTAIQAWLQTLRDEQLERLRKLDRALGNDKLSLEEKARRTIRAAKFGETPKAVWFKIFPTIPEGVSTTRANEMFCWARSTILEQELRKGLPEEQAIQNTVRCLLSGNVY